MSSTTTTATKLTLRIHAQLAAAHAAFVRANVRRAHALIKPPLRELSIAMVNDARMSELHERFMNIPGPTDVLSFELDHDDRGRVTAGEVVVCVPEARRQANKRGIPFRIELLLYALHGMLHLCGFDDRTDRGFRIMHRREDDILIALGFGPVFAAAPAPARVRRPTKRRNGYGGNRR
ncbi:MAG TPA: rRNA maturation RNase YbeY [Tepidisphaeraceae bacterium]|nr:rRNA maturation RNase YbeY [Tepidisphaeraceae bacterium]